MLDIDEIYQNQLLELRRGSIVLAIFGLLARQKYYGYSLLQALESSHIPVEASTLYPLLRRFEKQGVLQSEWDTADSRPRKYYTLTPQGQTLFHQLKNEWADIGTTISRIIKETS